MQALDVKDDGGVCWDGLLPLVAIRQRGGNHDLPSLALGHALQYARDMGEDLADRFVGMYVNDWTLDYGPRGREAIRKLLGEAHAAGIIPNPVAVEFVGK